MKIGINKIGFSTSHLYVDMKKLAFARNEDPNKYLIGIGQSKMAVVPPSQDVVTMAANAAIRILTKEDRDRISFVIFATESGIDNSKAAAVYLAHLLGLKNEIRAIELKQACYGATAGIQLARGFVALNPENEVLVIAADNARYGINTPGEPTQGGGAVAMLISQNPQILALEEDSTAFTQDIMDFWRPLGKTEAVVDGKYSKNTYLEFFEETWQAYLDKTGYSLSDFAALLFHLPYTKLGLKALQIALKDAQPSDTVRLAQEFEHARFFNSEVGNLYTGSLYLSLLSLLCNSEKTKAGQRIGLFSYGSGAEAEFYTGIIQPDFKKGLAKVDYNRILNLRKEISVSDYEQLFKQHLFSVQEGAISYKEDPAPFFFSGVHDFKRQYEKRGKKPSPNIWDKNV
ncbi:hydroxymethylglutaryl-CoA synthase [Liquorilactobacillus oeni]|uniref:Hydroxymethylglutaryl-CoA synthase n=1 Tax=Liquorilactobacillus oeni DSM 19972 TaxID=1423777 RepID=A0A0R1M8J6_9LACO|nr:hydroxymethylglutaryl-CoA synthase [Liquorilactobacillus oeni]KRL04241.1 hydroxymethylglutaryl-CoA synthase [Liquorilactobacillus oeni DSM 19972]